MSGTVAHSLSGGSGSGGTSHRAKAQIKPKKTHAQYNLHSESAVWSLISRCLCDLRDCDIGHRRVRSSYRTAQSPVLSQGVARP
eukprot:3043426-Rhodomonas_salina.1